MRNAAKPSGYKSWNHGGKPRSVEQAEPGFFLMRRKGTMLMPARIMQHENGEWQAIVNGAECESHADWTRAPRVADIWLGAKQIGEAEYESRLAAMQEAAKNPDHPAADPGRPVDFRKLRSLF